MRFWEYFSIYWKLPTLFLVTLLVSSLYYTFFAYVTSRELLLNQIDRQMRLSVGFVDLLIGEDYFDRATKSDGVSEEEYRENSKKMIMIAEMVGLKNLYSFYKRDGKYHYTNNNGFSIPFFSEYGDYWANLFETSDDGKERFDNETDSYGPSRSIIVRRTTAAGNHYLIGADILLSDIQELERRMLHHAIVTGIFFFFLVGVFSYAVTQLITRPLKGLNDYVVQVSRTGFTSDSRMNRSLLPSAQTVGDETRLLARNFDRMQTALVDFSTRLQETVAARERAEVELRIAGKIQQSFLPTPPKNRDRCDIRGKMQPAKHAGGDLYDYYWLDDERLCFMIGDVSGKGMPAAMFMATSITLFRAATKPDAGDEDAIVQVMAWVDRRLAEHNDALMFVTALMGILNCRTGEIVLSNGGHNPPVLLREGKPADYVTLNNGILIGVDMGKPFDPTRLTLRPGDTLLLYTDGVTEAMDVGSELYGEQKLLDLLDRRMPELQDSNEIVEAVFQDVLDFSRGRDLADDVTVLALGLPKLRSDDSVATETDT